MESSEVKIRYDYAFDKIKKLDEREENFIQILPQEKFKDEEKYFGGRDTILQEACFLNVDDSDSGSGYDILVNRTRMATYETSEQAKAVIEMIAKAVNRGDKVFRLPEQDYFYQVESLFNAQRILKKYMVELKKAVGVGRLILKDRIAFEQQRIIEILAELKTA